VLGMCNGITWGRAKTMPAAGSRYNRTPDANAIAHGVCNRMGGKGLVMCNGIGARQELCQQQVLDTTVPRMQMQLRMG